MADPFSLAASAFAVVGVADVVLKACGKCYQFLSDIEDAPIEIESLRVCLEDNRTLVQTLKTHIEDLRNPTSTTFIPAPELLPPIDQVSSAVRALQRELSTLQVRASKYKGKSKLWANVKHVLDGKTLRKSLERMEQSKNSLSVALSLVEGKRSAIGQKMIEDAVHQSTQRTTSTLGVLQRGQAMTQAQNERVLSYSMHQKRTTTAIRRDLQQSHRNNENQHNRTQKTIKRGNQHVMNKLEDIHTSLSSRTIAAKMSNREVHFIGPNRETALASLLLMKDPLRQAVLGSISHGRDPVSQDHLYWIQSQFNALVSSALQEAAAQHPHSTASSLDPWFYLTGLDATSAMIIPSHRSDNDDNCGIKDLSVISREKNHPTRHQRRSRSSFEFITYDSDIGQLAFKLPKASGKEISNSSRFETQVWFLPKSGTSLSATNARFVKSTSANSEVRLYTQLNTFRMVEDMSLHEELYTSGTIEEIDAAIRGGRITPYDTDSDGLIISLACAGASGSTDLIRYLDNQGVGGASLNGEGDVLLGVWVAMMYSDNIFCEMQTYLDGKFDPSTTASGFSLIPPVDQPASQKKEQRLHSWIRFLVQNSYDLETCDSDGYTPLLSQCRRRETLGATTISALLKSGADPHAIRTQSRENAIQLALCSNELYEYGHREIPSILEEKLTVLIEAGVDLHHRDEDGDTPSLYARLFNCWATWCRVLKRTGREIEEELREEGNEWLMERGWRKRLVELGLNMDHAGEETDEGDDGNDGENLDAESDEDLEHDSDEDMGYESERVPEPRNGVETTQTRLRHEDTRFDAEDTEETQIRICAE